MNITEILTQYILPWILTSGVKIIIILIASFAIVRIAMAIIRRAIIKGTSKVDYGFESEKQDRQKTLVILFGAIVKTIVWITAIVMILSEFNINVSTILAGAGIAGVALGFGAQYLVRDIINGIFLIFENHFKVNDYICVGDICGTVQSISLRTTVIRSGLDGIVHHIPNGQMNIVSNYTEQFSRVHVEVGVAYDSDIDHVEKVINDVGVTMAEDEAWKDIVVNPLKFLRVNNFGDSAIDIKILGDVIPGQQWMVAGEFRRRMKKAFDENNITIPFPQRDVHMIEKK